MANSTLTTPNYPPGAAGQPFRNLWPIVQNTGSPEGCPSNLYYSIITTEGIPTTDGSNGGWQPGPPVYSVQGWPGQQAQGPAQVLPSTAIAYGHPDAVDPSAPDFISENLLVGQMVADRAWQNSGGDPSATVFTYKGATDAAGRASVANKVGQAVQQAGALGNNAEGVTLNRTPGIITPLTNNDVSDTTYDSLFPDIVVKEGLDIQPWYQNPNLITGNPRLRKEVQPVTFKIFLEDFTLSSKGRTGKPIEIQLNASMKSYNLAMKHLFHQQRTRTAFHITMWGMQADMIEGSCSTGVFMNQFGLTDYFSTFTVDNNLKQLVTSGVMFGNTPNSNASIDPTTLTQAQKGLLGESNNLGGAVSVQQTNGSNAPFQSTLNSMKANQNSAFRVAAQDAFQEFLSLFKMNGCVWLHNRTYNRTGDSLSLQANIGETREWTDIQAWSPKLGMSSSQENSRNNDVITRGTVMMQFRNFVYEGYFKSLQWTMDAAKPFSWDFNFTFQVERTLGKEFIPGH